MPSAPIDAALLTVLPCARAWIRRRAGRDWEDVLHDAIVYLLERTACPVAHSPAGVMHLLKLGAIEAHRRIYGRTGAKVQAAPQEPGACATIPTPHTDPSTRLDLQRAIVRMPPRVQRMLVDWAMGDTLRVIADTHGVTPARVSQLLSQHAPTWREYHAFQGHPASDRQREVARRVGAQNIAQARAARKQRRQQAV
jgi:hypothetical protein